MGTNTQFSRKYNARGQRIYPSVNNSDDRRGLTRFQCVVILSIPLASLYIGYRIGIHFMPENMEFGDHDAIARPLRLNYSWYNSHNLSIHLVGRLGNQMFQYAAMYGIARANGLRPQFTPLTSDLQRTFPHLPANKQVQQVERGANWRKFHESAPNKFDSRAFNLNFMTHIEMFGFFQSWHYFDHVRGDIRKQFSFPLSDRYNDSVGIFLKKIAKDFSRTRENTEKTKPPEFVGVHVRRGDMLSPERVEQGYTTATPDYIATAMQYFSNKHKGNTVFVVCSDDIKWCRQHITAAADNVFFSPFPLENPAKDLELLSRCNHTIMSVGSFSWWAATLAGGEVTYFKNFPKPRTSLAKGFRPSDYYQPYWIPI